MLPLLWLSVPCCAANTAVLNKRTLYDQAKLCSSYRVLVLKAVCVHLFTFYMACSISNVVRELAVEFGGFVTFKKR